MIEAPYPGVDVRIAAHCATATWCRVRSARPDRLDARVGLDCSTLALGAAAESE